MSGIEIILPLLRTKLHRPPVSPNILPRARLLERLTERLNRPLTLVSAPAGYGKTTLVSRWLETCDCPSAWVSLDEKDNDLRLFLSYFVAATQSVFPHAVHKTAELTNAANLPPLSVLASSLINELDLIGRDFILALDDIHLVREKSVHALLTELLNHPPRPMHLVLVGRQDPPLPITSMRAKGLVTEIRVGDLLFTAGETESYLEFVLHEQIDKVTAAAWAEKTEGWVTGLRLAALAMRGEATAAGKLLELKGPTAYVMDYLVTEVLNAQPPIIGGLLLRTSILDRFCAPLCDALCEPGSEPRKGEIDGQDFITSVQRSDLFVIPLDSENTWFRYHHLFRDLLRSRLRRSHASEEIDSLHSRASVWFDKNGFVEEAVQHAMAATDLMGVVQLLEQNRQAILNNNRWYFFEKWLPVLPDTLIQQRPELLLAQAWVHYFHYRFELIPPITDVVESLLGNEPKEQALYGEIYLFKGVIRFWQGDGLHSLKYIEDALERIPPRHHMMRGFAEIYFGLAGQMQGQMARVVHFLSDLLNDRPLELSRKLRLHTALVWVHIISGDLGVAFRLNRQLRDVAIKHHAVTFITWSSYNQGLIHFSRNEMDGAIHHFSRATETGHLMLRRAIVDSLAGLSLAYQAMKQADEAEATLERLFEYVHSIGDPALLDTAHSCEARLSLMKGEVPPEPGVLLSDRIPDAGVMALWLEVPVITRCRVLLAEGSDAGLQEADKRLQQCLRLNQTHHNTCQTIQIMVLQSLVLDKLRRAHEALTVLEEALALAEPGGWVRPFLELGPPMADLLNRLKKQNIAVGYTEKLLAAFRDDEQMRVQKAAEKPVPSPYPSLRPAIPSQPLVEPLTNREVDILELLAQRLRNKEIAEKLFISPETVKAHLRNLYQKLEVSNRREAAERAKDLGIVPRS